MRFKAIVEYDGTEFFGFQRQREEPTIQQELEQAISNISGAHVDVVGAGRTDTGVHALGQVIAFDLDWRHSEEDLLRAINAHLPESIVLRLLTEVNEEFHPRYDARQRIYEYRIYNERIRSPFLGRHSWHVAQKLDDESMNRSAQLLVGVHDFATFGQPPKGDNTVREVFLAQWRRESDMLIFKVAANAFLYRMVRSLVGTMKAVGDGSWTLEQFESALIACDRSRAGQTAPARGLILTSVSYLADDLGE